VQGKVDMSVWMLTATIVLVLLAAAGAARATDVSLGAQTARAPAVAARPVHSATVTVTGVSDGDTATVKLDDQSVRVRLANIDAPERGQPWGRRAEQSLRDMVWKRPVRIDWREVDRHGRPIVTMTLEGIDGIDVSEEQVRRGLAWVYRRYSRDARLTELETQAREAGRGLWADPAPVAPWEWKRLKREGGPPS
jgi:micrococcal nuclease